MVAFVRISKDGSLLEIKELSDKYRENSCDLDNSFDETRKKLI